MNTKHLLYKEKLKIERELYALEEIQRNANWIKLEKPYRNGYWKYYDLRDDIKNRSDAWVFYKCIELVGGRSWSKDKKFRRKLKKGVFEIINPKISDIDEKAYNNLHPAVKKYFREVQSYQKGYNFFRKQYYCNVPSYYFVAKVKPRWITEYQEYDGTLKGQIAEKDELLWGPKFYDISRRWGSAPGWFCATYHRSDRRHNKKTLHCIIKDGDYDADRYEFRYGHRNGATWDWW